MKKRFFTVTNVLCSSLLAVLGLGGCRTHKTNSPDEVECVYAGPPVIYEERVDTVIKEEIKVVYGPPVEFEFDWHTVHPDEEGVYDVAEVMPQFPGGDGALVQWVADHLQYPDEARKAGVGGRVIVSFIVMADGSVDGVTVLRSVHPLLDAEAVRLVQAMPRWTPGRMQGKAVPVRYFIPVKF